MALGWCLKNPNVSTVLLGASKIEQLNQNLETNQYSSILDEDMMGKIEKIINNKPN